MPVIAGERLAAKDWVRSYYNARSRPLFLARHMSIGKWLMYLLLWQFAFVAAYIVGEIGAMGGRRGLRHCVANIIAYMFGMLNGALASVVLLFPSAAGRGTSRDAPPRSSRLASSLTEECSIVHWRDYPTEAR